MKRGFSLVEMMVAVLIFAFLFIAILSVQYSSDRSWRLGRDKLIEQQEARRAIGDISQNLRESNPAWVIANLTYSLSISDLNRRIDFYNPIFDADGKVTSIEKITYKLDPNDPRQLLKKEGIDTPVVVASEIENINFGGGCLNCTGFNCTSVDPSCPLVKINLTTKKQTSFNMDSQVTLRNKNADLQGGGGIIEPPIGEF